MTLVGGDITITGGNLSVSRGRISLASAASPGEIAFNPRPGVDADGSVFTPSSGLRLGTVALTDKTTLGVTDSTTAQGVDPTPGGIDVTTGSLRVDNSRLSAGTGAITLTARDTFSSTGSRITTDVTQGNGGNIGVTAGNIQLGSGTVISANSSGPGNAGDIRLIAGDAIELRSTAVAAEAPQGSGGNITLVAPRLIRLVDSLISSLVATSGGDVVIDPQFFIMKNSQVLLQALEGAGGNIQLAATNSILVDPSSRIDVSNERLDFRDVSNLSGLVPLAQGLVAIPVVLLGDRCAATPDGEFSSFVNAGRDTVPAEPGGFGASPILLDDVVLETGGLGQSTLTTRRLGLVNSAIGCGF